MPKLEQSSMNKQKRFFLASLSCVAVGTVAEFMGARAWAGALDRQRPMPTPPPPSDPASGPAQNAPGIPLNGPNLDPRIDPKQVLEHNDSQIHDNVEKLYFLAAQLKAEVEKTNSQNVLSLAMVQKCEQIEKYAKQIKSLAKGG
jgi:hypothetical protein